ncbi:MAG: hypothetical protein ACI9MB_004398 [Verrucomicrobiales bacterium]|jgi:hypothetical protein
MKSPSKICASCGREFEWRKKWKDCWEEVKYCSLRCKGKRPGEAGERLEAEILKLLGGRSRNATICPSEVARIVFGDTEWRGQMEVTRQAARRLVARGEIEITQQGTVVDPSKAKGPIRLRLALQ